MIFYSKRLGIHCGAVNRDINKASDPVSVSEIYRMDDVSEESVKGKAQLTRTRVCFETNVAYRSNNNNSAVVY